MLKVTEDKGYFKLFANCIPVKGAVRSTICDLQKNDYTFIPNGLCDILNEYPNLSIEEIKKEFDKEFSDTIDDYYNFLVKNEYGFRCTLEELEMFPDLDLSWDEPYLITNAIIDNDHSVTHDYKRIFDQLEELSCKHIQLRFFGETNKNELDEIFLLLENRRIISVELIIPANTTISTEEIFEMIRKYPRITVVYVHSAEKFEVRMSDNQSTAIVYITDNIMDDSHCGIINMESFSINIKTFSESKNFNTCLNKKISIDTKGNIKNCPSCKHDYGNFRSTGLKDAYEKEKFKDMWHITKDQIEVCKDCEFRKICTDCRVFIEDKDNIFSKPAKCPYNPYTAKGF